MNIFEKLAEMHKNATLVISNPNSSVVEIDAANKVMHNLEFLVNQFRKSEIPGSETYNRFGKDMTALKGEKVVRHTHTICTAFMSYYKAASKHDPNNMINYAEWAEYAEFLENVMVPNLTVDAHILLIKTLMNDLNLWEKEKYSAMASVMSYASKTRSDIDTLIIMENFDKVYEG